MSPSVEPSWPTPLEPCDTLHGGLQRGRGDAVLAALERADDEARALLLDCILRDPRGNQQDESRAVAYGELAWTLALDVEPLVERVRTCDPTDEFSEGADYRRDAGLARDVLCELARRGHRRALEVLRDYVAWGHRWNWVLRGLAEDGDLERVRGLDEVIARRFEGDALADMLRGEPLEQEPWRTWSSKHARIHAALVVERTRVVERDHERSIASTLPFEERLGRLESGETCDLPHTLAAAALPAHVPVLVACLDPSRTRVFVCAARALGRLGGEQALTALLDAADRLRKVTGYPLGRSGALAGALAEFDDPRVLTLARSAYGSEHPLLDQVALHLFERRATLEDVPRVVERLRDQYRTPEDDHAVRHAAQVLGRFPGQGWIDELVHAAHDLRCASCRGKTLRALSVLDAPRFERTLARACLWDCDDATVGLGIRTAPLDAPLVRPRLVALAARRAISPHGSDDAMHARHRLAIG